VKARLGKLVAAVMGGLALTMALLIYERATKKDRLIAEQTRIIAALERRLDRSWADERVADVRVDAITKDQDGRS
jgi:hypothetical protein